MSITPHTTRSSEQWAVVGGGMLGLGVAWRLIRAGRKVTLFESQSTAGGLASAWQIGDVTWDRFYHVILASDEHLRTLLDELALESSLRWSDTKTGFYSGGSLHSMSSALEFLKFPPLRLADKLRLGWTIFRASRIRNWRPLEHMLVEDWLRKMSGDRVVDAIWLPLLRAKLGDAYRQTSAAFIWATINRMYKARRTGVGREQFGYVEGGYAAILRRLEDRIRELGSELEFGERVTRVSPSATGIDVEVEGVPRSFDRVVITTPPAIAARLMPSLGPSELSPLQQANYLGVVCCSLLLRKSLSPFYVTNITDPGFAITGVIESTNVVALEQLGGHHLVYLPKYVSPDDPLLDDTDESIGERMLATLEAMYPQFSRDDVVAMRIARARHVMPIPTLGYSQRVMPFATSVPGLYVANSSQIVNDTLNVNAVLELAGRFIDSVADDTPVQSTCPPQVDHHDQVCEPVARS